MPTVTAGATDVGRVRSLNDNAFLVNDDHGVYLVANGMGHGDGGKRASDRLVEIARGFGPRFVATAGNGELSETERRRALLELAEQVLRDGCAAVHREAKSDEARRNMATTATMVALFGAEAAIAHVGHNVVYHVRDGEATRLTTFHTVDPSETNDLGFLKKVEPGTGHPYVLTRALGLFPAVEVDSVWVQVRDGDQLLLCSKGLIEEIAVEEAAAVVAERAPADACAELIRLANEAGGHDNITVVVLRFGDARASKRLQLDTQGNLQTLAGMRLFAHLTSDELLSVLRVVFEERYEAGEEIVSEGTDGDRLLILASGQASVSKAGVELTKLGPGSDFGAASFVDGGTRSATVRAITDVTCLTIRRADFMEALVSRDPHLAARLLWSVCQNVTERLRALTDDYVDATAGPSLDA